MRNVFNALAILFLIFSVLFVVLPMGTFGLLAPGLALLFAGLAFFIATPDYKKTPKWLSIIALLFFAVIAVKALMPSEVANDNEFEQHRVESKDESIKDLEALEDELE